MKNYTELVIDLAKSQDWDAILNVVKEAKKYKNNKIDSHLNWKLIGNKFIMKNNDEDDEGKEIIYTITGIDDEYVDIKWNQYGTEYDDSYDLKYAELYFQNGRFLLLK